MQVGLRHFDSQTLDWLSGRLRSGEATRHGLARELCERTGWLNALGRPCLSAAVLPTLAKRLGLEPAPPRGVPDPTAAPAVPAEDVPDTRVACPLEDPGPVWLDPVGGDSDRRLREAMMATHRPLGRARPPGGQMRCWIRSERHGTLGGIGFGSAAWQLRARDEWIGWSADARAASIGRVIRSHRFLLMPGVRVHGLASRILRMAAERVAGDREARYAVRPAVACTHVGTEHSGYSCHCAGWTVAGRTGGRRGEAGTVRVLELERGWRTALHGTERRPVGALAGAYDGTDADWAEREYGRTRHTDGRAPRRIAGMGRAWLKNMGKACRPSFRRRRSGGPPAGCCRTRGYPWSTFWNRIPRRPPTAAGRRPSSLPCRTRRRSITAAWRPRRAWTGSAAAARAAPASSPMPGWR